MTTSGHHNLVALNKEMQEGNQGREARSAMLKCTQACFLSLGESKLLPTEDRCLNNCFVKTQQFFNYFDKEISYQLRNIDGAMTHDTV